MNYKKYKRYKFAYVIEEERLNDFIDFLENKNFENINFEVNTIDGTSIKFSNLKSLLSYENFDNRKIIDLGIDARKDKDNLNITFEADESLFPNSEISYYFSYNNQDWGFKFDDDLDTRVKEFHAGFLYNIFTKWYFIFLLNAIFFLVIIVFGSIYFNTIPTYLSFIIGMMSFGTLSLFALSKFRLAFFSRSIIALNRQKIKYVRMKKNIKTAINILFVVIILGLLVSIGASYIFSKFS
ncbi:hypothetical protein [Bernardetia sp. MNP-M8]|uniref:hypothetical protein n=1 Tax=Bernardetia sp. MNP-M8 TaxID=3127470 RepID=UPI0030D20ADE